MPVIQKRSVAAKSSAPTKVSKSAKASVPRARVEEDPTKKYGFTSSIFCPDDKPGTQIPMANICRRNPDGSLNPAARVVSLSMSKARIVLAFVDELREWIEQGN